MTTDIALERCLTYINCQLKPVKGPETRLRSADIRPAVTISRQTGSGGHSVAEKLAAYLQARSPKNACPWTVFDRNLVEKVLEDHNLPARLAQFMPEDRKSAIEDALEEVLGLHPPTSTLVPKIAETILHLAELGHVILLGRGANVITATLANVFHVRLVGSLEKRAEHVQQTHQISRKAALAFIAKEDLGRRRYLDRYFKKDIDDPTLYDLVINTDRISYAEAAQMIGEAVLRRFAPAA
jgi:cytidylate kinase